MAFPRNAPVDSRRPRQRAIYQRIEFRNPHIRHHAQRARPTYYHHYDHHGGYSTPTIIPLITSISNISPKTLDPYFPALSFDYCLHIILAVPKLQDLHGKISDHTTSCARETSRLYEFPGYLMIDVAAGTNDGGVNGDISDLSGFLGGKTVLNLPSNVLSLRYGWISGCRV